MPFQLEGSFQFNDDIHALGAEISSSTGGEAVYSEKVSVTGDVVVAGNFDSTSEHLAAGGKLKADSLTLYDSTIEVGGALEVKLLCVSGDKGGKVGVGADSKVPLVFKLWGGSVDGEVQASVFEWDDENNTEEDYERLAEAFGEIGLELQPEVSLDDVLAVLDEGKVEDLIGALSAEE